MVQVLLNTNFLTRDLILNKNYGLKQNHKNINKFKISKLDIFKCRFRVIKDRLRLNVQSFKDKDGNKNRYFNLKKKKNENALLKSIMDQDTAILSSLFEKDNAIRINIPDKLLIGRVMLFVVAFLWGTYSPALKYIYTIPGAPVPSVLVFMRASITSLLLLATSSVKNSKTSYESDNVKDNSDNNGDELGIFGKCLNYSPDSIILCALEIGLWNFMGDACQSIGLELTSATRSAFLVQTATLFTPILAYISGDKLPSTGWLICLTGLIGSVIVALDGQISPNDIFSNTLPCMSSIFGELIVILSAFFYSMCTIRISASAKKFKPVQLAMAMNVTFAIFAATWVASDVFNIKSSVGSLHELWNDFTNIKSWLALLWLAAGPGALASLLQAKGQQVVPPSQSQIFYTITPFSAALIACMTLENEEMGFLGWTGGLILILGGLSSFKIFNNKN